MTVAVGAAQPSAAMDLAGPAPNTESCKEVKDLDTLHEVTSCGLTALQVKPYITLVSVTNQGSQLAFWPPALCQFTAVTSVNLSGNAITFIPQSIQTLTGLKVLSLSRNNLTSVCPELSCLTALTELDLSRNELRALPAGLCSLSGLKVLNVMANQLSSLPDNFGGLSGLIRLGLKSNKLTALPPSFCQLTNLVELFITDNQLETLPKGFGQLVLLVKLQASFNPFTHLPADMWSLPELEMFRLAVGQLQEWPAGLAEAGGLPKLAWCSLGRNPAAVSVPAVPTDLPRVEKQQLHMAEKLGQGASGEVFLGMYGGREVAVKIFTAEVSPDGSTKEEMAINCAINHPNLTRVLALVVDGSSTGVPGVSDVATAAAAAAAGEDVDGVVGMVLELVHGTPLADRPTSEHLLRCKWADGQQFSSSTVVRVCHGVASALAHLHSRGICHGDVYAHNIMVDDHTRPVICDFGAAYCYNPKTSGRFCEAMEVRAFGLFMQDMVTRLTPVGSSNGGPPLLSSDVVQLQLQQLVQRCLVGSAMQRPLFAEIEQQLLALN